MILAPNIYVGNMNEVLALCMGLRKDMATCLINNRGSPRCERTINLNAYTQTSRCYQTLLGLLELQVKIATRLQDGGDEYEVAASSTAPSP